jgi:hypothetical protein
MTMKLTLEPQGKAEDQSDDYAKGEIEIAGERQVPNPGRNGRVCLANPARREAREGRGC